MKRVKFFLIFLLPFLITTTVMGQEIIRNLCKKKSLMEEKLKNYKEIINMDLKILDGNGKLLNDKKRKKVINILEKKRRNEITPFNIYFIHYYNYTVKDNEDSWIITAKLKDRYRKYKAEEGKYVVSKKSGYFKEEYTDSLNSSIFLKNLKIHLKYGEIEKDIYAPVWMEMEIDSKKIFGISRVVKAVAIYRYERIK